MPQERLVPVPAGEARTERTRTSAAALRSELDRRGATGGALDLFTEDAHARRSRAVFADELGPERRLGVVALPPTGYVADEWFRSSAGVKTTLVEFFAWAFEAF
ncbi:MAG: hypothetical protein R3F34_04400 [Planctomycetota bacterium]